jgi:hypothetical protein
MKKTPKIIVDLDEVIAETQKIFCSIAEGRYKAHPDRPLKHRGTSLFDHYDVDEKGIDDILEVFHAGECVKASLIPGARAGIEILRHHAEVWVVSARPENVFDFSKEWLDKKKVYYDKLIHTNTSLGKYRYVNDVDLIIEDKGETAHYYAKHNTDAILLAYDYNRRFQVNLDKLHIVNNWTTATTQALKIISGVK